MPTSYGYRRINGIKKTIKRLQFPREIITQICESEFDSVFDLYLKMNEVLTEEQRYAVMEEDSFIKETT